MARIGIANSGGGTRGGGKSVGNKAARAGKVSHRSNIKQPKVNLDSTYGITNTGVNSRSAVHGPKSNRAKLSDNQSTLTRKASRHVK